MPDLPLAGLVSDDWKKPLYATAICRVVGPSPSSVVPRMSRTSLVFVASGPVHGLAVVPDHQIMLPPGVGVSPR